MPWDKVLALLWPFLKEFLSMVKDEEAVDAAYALKHAKTKDEKHEAAKKIAARMYNRSIE